MSLRTKNISLAMAERERVRTFGVLALLCCFFIVRKRGFFDVDLLSGVELGGADLLGDLLGIVGLISPRAGLYGFVVLRTKWAVFGIIHCEDEIL